MRSRTLDGHFRSLWVRYSGGTVSFDPRALEDILVEHITGVRAQARRRLQALNTTSIVLNHKISGMCIKTPKHEIASSTFNDLGIDRKIKISKAMHYVERMFTSGKGINKDCVVVNGTRDGNSTRRERNHRNKKDCFCCKSNENLTTHHIVPRSRYGSNDSHNLVDICKSCHLQIEEKIESMEKDKTKETAYLDYVAILIVFTFEKMRTPDTAKVAIAEV